jgi:hypothetical protein
VIEACTFPELVSCLTFPVGHSLSLCFFFSEFMTIHGLLVEVCSKLFVHDYLNGVSFSSPLNQIACFIPIFVRPVLDAEWPLD